MGVVSVVRRHPRYNRLSRAVMFGCSWFSRIFGLGRCVSFVKNPVFRESGTEFALVT